MKRFIACFIAVIIFSLPLASCGAKVVKTVGTYEVDEELDSFFGSDDEKLAAFFAPYALADEMEYDYTSDEFVNYCASQRERFLAQVYGGDEDALAKELEKAGMTEDIYVKVLEQDTLKSDLYDKLILAGEIETDRKTMKIKFLRGEAVMVKRILVSGDDAEDKIKEAAAQIAAGETFESVRSEYSDGDIGNYGDSFIVTKGNYDKAYEDVCYSIEVGDVSEPFKTDAGWCIVERYELTEEAVDEVLTDLITEYTEGQFSIRLEEIAKTLDVKNAD